MALKGFDFGNEAGDDATSEEIASYFVEQEVFSNFLRKDKRILISTAKKGVGKSALLKRISFVLQESNDDVIVVNCRGSELSRASFNLTNELKTPNDYIRDWMVRICALVNREIAKRINFAITDDQMAIIESAEIDGYKQKNLVSSLTSRFEGFLEKLGANPKKIEVKNHIEVLKRMNAPTVYLLIDDLDATFQNTDLECLSMSTFFSACRYLTQDVSGICFRVTMRSDVWPTIRRYDESLDKLEQYVTELEWSVEEFRTLLYKRIYSQSVINSFSLPDRDYNESVASYEERVLSILFVDKVRWGDKDVNSYKIIHTLSYQRPRWAIQLCKLSKDNAIRRRRNLILKEDIDSVWGDYGSRRIADLVAEHKHQCKQIEDLITSFRGTDRLLDRNELLLFIKNKILNHVGVFIDSKKSTSPLEVAHFLFRIGFVVARSDEDDGSYEHYSFRDMPDLLSTRTNNDFGMKWEIHPCYRQALDIKKINRAQREKRGVVRRY